MSTEPAESAEPSWEEQLTDPVGYGLSETEAQQIRNEIMIGKTAMLLQRRGQDQAAALMLDVQGIDYYSYFLDGRDPWDDKAHVTVAQIDVETYLLPKFSEDLQEQIREAMHVVATREHRSVNALELREVLPEVGEDWRQQLSRELATERPTNQARKVRLESGAIQRDGLFLTNLWEQRIYTTLLQVQAEMPDTETINIAPLVGMRVKGHTYEPDVLITYKGFAGVIEVDGPHHSGRRAADGSRDRLLKKGGIKVLERITVEDLETRESARKFVDDFLAQLGR
ncbi:hypothetical protein [Kineococcus radiotolerans]|uniref:DUF559 domain-containing protein n=1 Tax=Kineococcus radiotolerans (strain ATCC BAA-149 / DSM 14245 / SRS30216) TaxID=266940 RepID=A6WH27_KINRD|nr:hypothetical protein [Kineococcus radiotolerans]ABS06116.1 hypothetical protein Krad_4657 [Kineococcus radiotolerans SRS30216 = ATCC BAA-149]